MFFFSNQNQIPFLNDIYIFVSLNPKRSNPFIFKQKIKIASSHAMQLDSIDQANVAGIEKQNNAISINNEALINSQLNEKILQEKVEELKQRIEEITKLNEKYKEEVKHSKSISFFLFSPQKSCQSQFSERIFGKSD